MNRNLPFEYQCYGCGAHYPGELLKPQCTACGEPLALTVPTAPDRALFERPAVSQWTYKELLPIARDEHVVSLGEGATPLITAPQLAVKTRFSEITLKLETANPTSSFKDRQVSVGISRARELGMDTVAVVSSGNVACAASAYAARAGMRAILLMHGHAASGKIAQASAYGGKAIRVDDKSAGAVFNLCLAACKEFGWYHLSTAGMYEPFNVEGAKTIAYEVYQQTGGRMPDWIVAPVGGGGLLGGIWRGLLDLQRLG
ncbi:MAG: pyridoxal-phosphate dependent enzyme, partial [Candidatus Hydrogenedentes bacterium]|nr:pyridoxal-phosphate dependent enzyme [Candidatus Hydrogenedentota bacterium]